MSGPIDQSRQLRLMEGANRLIVELSKRPTWTIAMGAMLVSGLRPVPGCTEVPKEAVWLLDESKPATPNQLYRARQVVDRWVEDREDEDARSTVPAEECTPLEFLEWCDDVYEGSLRAMKPEWLDYLVSLTEVPSPSAPQTGSAIEMTERLLLLEHFATVVKQSGAPREPATSGSDDAPQSAKAPPGFYVARTRALIDSGEINAVYALAVATAQDAAMNPFDTVELLHALHGMAGEERWQHALRLVPSELKKKRSVLHSSRGHELFVLDKTVLQQYLLRLRPKLEKAKSSGR